MELGEKVWDLWSTCQPALLLTNPLPFGGGQTECFDRRSAQSWGPSWELCRRRRSRWRSCASRGMDCHSRRVPTATKVSMEKGAAGTGNKRGARDFSTAGCDEETKSKSNSKANFEDLLQYESIGQMKRTPRLRRRGHGATVNAACPKGCNIRGKNGLSQANVEKVGILASKQGTFSSSAKPR